jgi:hypothetical protein
MGIPMMSKALPCRVYKTLESTMGHRRNHEQAYGPSISAYGPVPIGGHSPPLHMSRGTMPA